MIKYVENMDKISEVCAYNTETGKFQIINNKNKELKTDIGFCAIVDAGVYGVFSSSEGPIFFANDQMYNLKKINYSFGFKHLKEKEGEFTFSINAKAELTVAYQITPFTDYDPWSSEEEVDFFQWLVQSQENEDEIQRFHNYYTRSETQ